MTNAATLPTADTTQHEPQDKPTLWQRLRHYFVAQTEASSKSDTKSFEGLL